MHNVKMVLSHFILLYCKPTTVNIVAIYVQQQLKNNLFLFVLGKKKGFPLFNLFVSFSISQSR